MRLDDPIRNLYLNLKCKLLSQFRLTEQIQRSSDDFNAADSGPPVCLLSVPEPRQWRTVHSWRIDLHDQTSSPVLAEVELFGCTDSPLPLPTYPRLVFGASQVWTNTGSLLLCGGADWSGPSNKCFKWSPRSFSHLVIRNV